MVRRVHREISRKHHLINPLFKHVVVAVVLFGSSRCVFPSPSSDDVPPSKDKILAIYLAQQELLRKVDMSVSYSGKRLVSVEELWLQTGMTSFRKGSERFAFDGEKLRMELRTEGDAPRTILNLPRPEPSKNMTVAQSANVLARQQVYDQMRDDFLSKEGQDGDLPNRVEIDLDKGTSTEMVTVFDGENFGRTISDGVATVYGKNQGHLIMGAFQTRFFDLWGRYVPDPTLPEFVADSKIAVSIPNLLQDERMLCSSVRRNGKELILLSGSAGMKGVPELAGHMKCWLDPTKGYALVLKEHFDSNASELESRVEFADYEQNSDGLWFPRRMSYTRFGTRIGSPKLLGKPLVVSELAIDSLALNEEVSSRVFLVQLPIGQKVFDFESGSSDQPVEYAWGGIENHKWKKSYGFAWIVAFNVIGAAVLVGLVLYLRKRKET